MISLTIYPKHSSLLDIYIINNSLWKLLLIII